MKVRSSTSPISFTLEEIPKNPSMVLVRFRENAKEITEDKIKSWEYDEYTLELPNTVGIESRVKDNYNEYLKEARAKDKYIPTINDLKNTALQRIDGHCSATIESGVVVDGKRYILTKYDGQNSLQNALVKAEKGENPIPFSAFGENKPSPYTPEQIKAIAKEADNWGLVNVTYYGYLKDWIARETDVDILNGIEYGSTLPDDLMQELATKLSQFGIDITKYADMLGGKD